MRSPVILPLVLLSTVLLGGCAMMQEDQGRDFSAAHPDVAAPPAPTAGAIYAQGTEVSLWQNLTARNIGDTLTIRLEESTSAEKSASTTAGKASKAELPGPVIFGRPVTVNGVPILE